MRISDWSSDVCSSDLAFGNRRVDRELLKGMKLPVPDKNLVSPKDIEDRVQSIYRQRAAEVEKGPRRTRTGESRPGWQDAHRRRLETFARRVDAPQPPPRSLACPSNPLIKRTRD